MLVLIVPWQRSPGFIWSIVDAWRRTAPRRAGLIAVVESDVFVRRSEVGPTDQVSHCFCLVVDEPRTGALSVSVCEKSYTSISNFLPARMVLMAALSIPSQVFVTDCWDIAMFRDHVVASHIDMVREHHKLVCDPEATVCPQPVHSSSIGSGVNSTWGGNQGLTHTLKNTSTLSSTC